MVISHLSLYVGLYGHFEGLFEGVQSGRSRWSWQLRR